MVSSENHRALCLARAANGCRMNGSTSAPGSATRNGTRCITGPLHRLRLEPSRIGKLPALAIGFCKLVRSKGSQKLSGKPLKRLTSFV